MLALPIHGYTWVVSPPGHIDEFFGARNRKISGFLIFISQLIVSPDCPLRRSQIDNLGTKLGKLADFYAERCDLAPDEID